MRQQTKGNKLLAVFLSLRVSEKATTQRCVLDYSYKPASTTKWQPVENGQDSITVAKASPLLSREEKRSLCGWCVNWLRLTVTQPGTMILFRMWCSTLNCNWWKNKYLPQDSLPVYVLDTKSTNLSRRGDECCHQPTGIGILREKKQPLLPSSHPLTTTEAMKLIKI